MSLPDDLASLKPQRLERLLEELAAISRRVSKGEALERPNVTLHLGSGRELRGALLDVTSDSGGAVALLLGAPERFAVDVTHVSVARLEAITVHDALGLHDRRGNAPPPGKLELRRAFGALGEALRASGIHLNLELPGAPEERDLEALRDLLEPLRQALEGIAADEIGRAALERIQTVALGVSARVSAKLEGAQLEVVTARAFADRPTAASLREMIETVL